MTKKRIRITDGGIALPLGNNTFLMKGRLHSQGGIGIGNGGKNDIEVEDGEVVKFNKDNIQVLSDQPMLNGISPANALLAGGNFNKIFKAQQNINGNSNGSYAETGTEKKYSYIGGTPKEARKKYLEFDTDLTNAINAIANEYGVDNDLLLHRITKEGIIDAAIAKNNNDYKNEGYNFSSVVNSGDYTPFVHLGLDDTFDLYDKYNLHRDIPVVKFNAVNEHFRNVNSVQTKNITDAIELMAADINYRKDRLVKNGINPTKAMISGSYNRGIKGILDMYNADKNSVENEYSIPNIYDHLINKDLKYNPNHKVNDEMYDSIKNDLIENVIYNGVNSSMTPFTKKNGINVLIDDMIEGNFKGLSEKDSLSIKQSIVNDIKKEKQKEFNKYLFDKNIVENISKDNYNDETLMKIPLFNHTYKYGGRVKYDRGGIGWLIDKLFSDNKKDNNKSNKKSEPLNLEELKLRQAYAESGFNSNSKSNKDAVGLFQIRENLLTDYNNAHGTNYTLEDLYDDKLNMSVRDWKMDKNLASDWAIRNNAPDSVVYAKSLGGYNMGNQNFLNHLGKAKAAGVDIYNSMDWISEKWLPEETVNYINFILRNQDNSFSRNQLAYEASKKKNADKVEGIRKGFKNGGQINMKLKHKNKLDITNIVMNEILPHSTGERKKFFLGGSEWTLIGNAGLNLLSTLGQGIAGSVNASKLRKMYDGMKRKSTYIPVAREHINTKVDVEPQLNLTAQTEYNLRRNAEMNTANAKVARNQVRAAALDRIRQDNAIYGDKYNKEAQLRNAEAELQTRYNLIDAENKLTDIIEQNDFDMQKAIGKGNASTMEAQTWGNAIASILGNTATSLMGYTTMKNDLLKSNNPATYEEKFKFEFGNLKNKLSDPKWVAKNQDWVDTNIGMLTKLNWAKSNMKGSYDKSLLPHVGAFLN